MADETSTATPENVQQFTFKAETKQLLNILIHSLYRDREVFLRELLSNASDALNRLRFEMVTNQDVVDPQAELNIHITVDKDARMLTIQDTGIGMTPRRGHRESWHDRPVRGAQIHRGNQR